MPEPGLPFLAWLIAVHDLFLPWCDTRQHVVQLSAPAPNAPAAAGGGCRLTYVSQVPKHPPMAREGI